MIIRKISIFLIILAACNPKANYKAVDKNKLYTTTPNSNALQVDTTALYLDTLKVNNHKFIQILKNGKLNGLFTLKGDTIIKPEKYYFDVIFPDINEDGYKDIRLEVFSNTPNECENYLFDKKNGTFRQIQNSYLDIKKIKGTKYFYSYNSAGCAGLSWESHLSKIEGWKEVDVAVMLVKGCGDKDDGIRIFKIANGSIAKLITTYPRISFDNNSVHNKWIYIKNYWSKNYSIFD